MAAWMIVSRTRVLIADDHALLAEGVAGLLEPEFDIVGIALDGRQLLAEAERLRPDVITMDIGMPLLNGLEAAQQLTKRLPRTRVVFVTQQIDLQSLRAAFAAGASGFVSKQSASTELVAAVRKAVLGRTYITPLLADKDPLLKAPAAGRPTARPFDDPLTARQREVLQLVAEGRTTRFISETLNISPKTVEFHKASMMAALGLRTTADLIRYALSRGIVTV